MQMPFGKYQGYDIGDIPVGYLGWVLDNLDLYSDDLREAIEDRVNGSARRSSGGPSAAAAPPKPPPPAASPIEQVIRAWHRQMTLKYHPDRGTHEQMLVVNDGAELLKKLAGVD